MGVARRKQDRRLAVFEDTYSMWTERRLTQAQAAEVLGVCERTFRRWVERYREEESEGGGVEALRDRRVSRASHLAAPVDEVMRMVDEYRTRYCGWNVRHYYTRYRRGGGERSYNWVRTKLQEAGAVPRGKGRGKHRKRRDDLPRRLVDQTMIESLEPDPDSLILHLRPLTNAGSATCARIEFGKSCRTRSGRLRFTCPKKAHILMAWGKRVKVKTLSNPH